MGRKADDPSVLDMRQYARDVPLLQGLDLVHATSVENMMGQGAACASCQHVLQHSKYHDAVAGLPLLQRRAVSFA